MTILFYYMMFSWASMFLLVGFSDLFPNWLNYTFIVLTPLVIFVIIEWLYKTVKNRKHKNTVENTISVKIKRDVGLYDKRD